MLEDNKAGDDPSPDSRLAESNVAVVDVKERSETPLFENPQEKADIEGVKYYNPTAIANAPDIKLHGVSVVESMPAPEGATQDEPGVTFKIQPESLNAVANEHTEAVNVPIGM